MKSLAGIALAPALIGTAFAIISGCAQSKDVIQPQIDTSITLKPAFLPDLDSMYTYELWMIKVQNPGDGFIGPGAEFTSLGKFTYRNATGRFMNATGDSAISNRIDLPETWLNYDYIAVSVENVTDPSPLPSGTYLLSDKVVDPTIRPISMKFPISLFGALGFYFVGTPTDDTTYWRFKDPADVNDSSYLFFDRYDENRGLWVCSRFRSEIKMFWDTLAVDSLGIEPTVDTSDTSGSWYIPDTVGIEFPDPDTGWAIETTSVIFAYDTLQHRRINIPWILAVDTMYNYNLYPVYDIDSITTPDYPYPLGRDIPYYAYSGPLGGLPDISPYGWRYNTWVLLEQPDTGDNSGLGLATVIPFGDGRQENFTGLNSWGVLPLGPFHRSDSADLSNPFSDNREVPDFPGGDFVKFGNIADSTRFVRLNLRRSSLERWGSVVVGMEPDPGMINIDTTVNFPIFFLSADLPSAGASRADEVQVLHNWSQFLPVINVTVDLHE